MTRSISQQFYVVAHEPGAENPSLPTWGNRSENPIKLTKDYPTEVVIRQPVADVPGAYQLLNVLTAAECKRFLELTESLGYLPDAAVSLPRDIRHNDNVVWVTDQQTDTLIWQRVTSLANQQLEIFGGQKALGLNARFRFYRYQPGDFFKPHSDGAWPGSRIINGELITNAYPDRYSFMTFLIFLNEDFEGGATRFLVNADNSSQPARQGSPVKAVDVRTPAGGVLCFPHGAHPLHCIHSSEPIQQGIKYIIRTDMLFAL
ncbi:2OG-Fe(II) oxygenase [Aestuariicella hydrocarbonica]|uniref:2OG-Fe(II) oxygenase n=1 Tax=Pseudomaricurvus hydrocarbonicus TaxID=1470433 RepID=A0A9E5JTY8_9GAMM|nr:2OG-Fe(II) oxygenase [Aestuariicella hydrocarbonica]NHO65446.1 2OG-Fe(II) oxygenase [Aestuariicella hydrocarbonica]